MPSSWTRFHGYVQSRSARWFFRRPLAIRTPQPLISFTFDDFPRSAWLAGGDILTRHGLAATYYVSLGLLGKDAPTGRIAALEDLPKVLEQGHELGCHTFGHCDSWATATRAFEESVEQNHAALQRMVPGADFRTFSYPISPPRPATKARMATRFQCCRGGGQTFNRATADLNHLAAYFLEKTRHDAQAVKDVIDHNRQARGWLILATHDISDSPTPFGCTPEFFRTVVQYAVDSGALILPVVNALQALRAVPAHN